MPEEAAAKPLTYEVERHAETVTVKCHGRLVAGLTNEFYKDVKDAVPGSKVLVLDLKELTYVDSMGLGTLVRIYVHTKGEHVELKVLHLGTQLRNLLKMTNLMSTLGSAEDHGITVA